MNIPDKFLKYFIDNKLIVFILLLLIIAAGIVVAPFDWQQKTIPRNPVPVDAIPDIGENQQIVFTKWAGRSPQDVENQVTYPLTVALLGVPEVKTVRSYSMFGFSTIYVIFKEDAEFYWSRSRLLEKLNSLGGETLPDDARPVLGPDATALGQVYWYTLEGRDREGNPTGGWDLDELRSIQDWYVKYGLQGAEGISEVASVGGHVKEYQIDIDPLELQKKQMDIAQLLSVIKQSNIDVGARTIEVNRVEYFIRGLGYIEGLEDIENTLVTYQKGVPVYVKDIANVTLGPAPRRGILDKEGSEAVGGVAVVRYGFNPLEAINNLKEKITEISPGLPSKVLEDGTVSQVKIVPFYDRTGLIYETLGTLSSALRDQIIVTIIVILVMIMNFRLSLLITSMLPITVLLVFAAMKIFHVDANIVALSGIAIAIGTIVDVGIVITENILNHLSKMKSGDNINERIFLSLKEVAGAVLTAIATTIVGFLPVFTMEAAEGKLFKPLAYTKTFALIASILIALIVLPSIAALIFKKQKISRINKIILNAALLIFGAVVWIKVAWWLGVILLQAGIFGFAKLYLKERDKKFVQKISNWLLILLVALILSSTWAPLGHHRSLLANFIFVAIVIGTVLGAIQLFMHFYPRILRWALDNKLKFLVLPVFIVLFGTSAWLGFGRVFSFFPDFIQKTPVFVKLHHAMPGFGKEFMPPLDEGSFLYMPTTMPHAGIEESHDVLRKLDIALKSVPEVKTVVGKIGRADTPLDPAPISMVETVINYKSEYITDESGERIKFRINREGEFARNDNGELIPNESGRPYRQWRDHVKTNQDIWDELVKAANIPGTTSAPRLQPISARLVMLQSGMRAPMGIKVKGPDLETIEAFGLELEKILKKVPSVAKAAVFAERIVGKPYLEIDIDRRAIAQYGISLGKVQQVIEMAIGGMPVSQTVEGRERYNIRVRFMREMRDDFEALANIPVPSKRGRQIPLKQLAEIRYVKGPQVIKSEDTFLVGYVLFDKMKGHGEVDVVEDAAAMIESRIDSGELIVPAGVSYAFAGSYENQIRASKKLALILPLSLLVIFLILYMQFKNVTHSLIVFTGVFVSWSGGFILLWFYGQDWFMNFAFMGMEMRELFQIHSVNLSVAVWVGFLALFGIATDDGVIISTYLDQVFVNHELKNIADIRKLTIKAGKRRIRPAMMTISTTVLALLPVLTSTGRGSDIMVPMAIPTFGGMLIGVITTFVVPVLYTANKERKFKRNK